MRGLNHRGRPGGQRGFDAESSSEPDQDLPDVKLRAPHSPTARPVQSVETESPAASAAANQESDQPQSDVDSKPDVKISTNGGSNESRSPKSEHEPVAGLKEDSPDSDSSLIKTSRSKKVPPNIQLFLDCPSVTDEAEGTYETLKECTYATKSLGNSGQDEAMTCDCKSEVGK